MCSSDLKHVAADPLDRAYPSLERNEEVIKVPLGVDGHLLGPLGPNSPDAMVCRIISMGEVLCGQAEGM